MPLRRRLALVSAAAVAIAIVLASLVCYLVVRGQLRGQVDDALNAQADAVQHGDLHALGGPIPGIPATAGGPAQYVQIVGSDGTSFMRQGGIELPITSRDLQVAGGNGANFLSDVHVGGDHLRELTFPVTVAVGGGAQSAAVQLARPLNGVDGVLSHLRLILFLLCLGGVALAAALGRFAARRVIAPLAEVARTAEHIGETEDLSSRIRVHSEDEVGQLASRFNSMIERLQGSRTALDASVHAQRQLVADASHELRTPITSLRTNIEVLLENRDLPEDERGRLMADVVEQSEELSALVGDLIELARGDIPVSSAEDVRLDRLVEEAVGRSRRDFPSVVFETSLLPVAVEGVPERLDRAISNLLHNAARHSPPGGAIDVAVQQGGVTIRDHGPGIDPDDLPHVFDRFYRGKSARGTQGSGLGLAIAAQVASQHGGSVSAENAPDGGAVIRLHLPCSPVQDAEARESDEQPTGGIEPVRVT